VSEEVKAIQRGKIFTLFIILSFLSKMVMTSDVCREVKFGKCAESFSDYPAVWKTVFQALAL